MSKDYSNTLPLTCSKTRDGQHVTTTLKEVEIDDYSYYQSNCTACGQSYLKKV